MLAHATRSPGFRDFTSDANRADRSCAFLAKHKRQRDFVPALALVSIDEVHSRRRDLDHGFVRLGLRDWQIRHLQNFRSTGLLDQDGFHV